MWFWSVSWSTNCSVYFSFFLVDQKNFCPVSDLFCSLSWIYCPVFFKKWEIDRTIGRPTDWPKPHFQKRLDKKFKRLNKKDLILDKFFFGRPKKMRNRPDNWSTKRLTKTTWTGLFTSLLKWCLLVPHDCDWASQLFCVAIITKSILLHYLKVLIKL